MALPHALEIYASSAGSGKTTALARQFINLLFPRPERFGAILAVTFTNKATEEVKSRVLEYLYQLSKAEPDGKGPVDLVYKDLDIQLTAMYERSGKKRRNDFIRNFARKSLALILEDYDRFSVNTIDSFFQKILRAFTRELDISFSFDVELDQKAAIERGIEELFNHPDPQLRKRLTEFYVHHITEKGSWNITFALKSLADELFKEENKLYSRAQPLTDEALLTFRNNKESSQIHFQNILAEYAENWYHESDRFGLKIEDFSNGNKGFAAVFKKFANKNFDTVIRKNLMKVYSDETARWESDKVSNANLLYQAKTESLKKIFHDSVTFFIDHYPEYLITEQILKHSRSHSVLNDLHRSIQLVLRAEDKILPSETMEKILEIVRSSEDAPFIYEKMGQRYENYLLDEFQDTSVEQWLNLKPLVENSLASGQYSMIVGDAKQSIYRFRGGTPKLLISGVKEDLKHFNEYINEKNLSSNYRSAVNIIRFNNTLFHLIGNSEINETYFGTYGSYPADIYRNCEQHFPKDKNLQGYVRAEFFTEENNKEENKILKRLSEIITSKVEQGYQYREIAVLVRKGKIGRNVSEYLINKAGIPVISDESLQVSAHSVVKLMVATFRYLLHPEDTAAVMETVFRYQNTVLKQNLSAQDWDNITRNRTAPAAETSFEELFLPEEITRYRKALLKMALPELTEELIRRYQLSDFPNAYLLRFCDLVLEYLSETKDGAHLSGFLNWWDETGSKKKILLTDSADAVRVLTIHKSKGLEFPVVILPFADWILYPETGQRAPKLWVFPDDEHSFRVPVDYKNDWTKPEFQGTDVHQAAVNEKHLSLADNLNLLYVALTRAGRELWILAPKPQTKEKPKPGKKKADNQEDFDSDSETAAVFPQKVNELLFTMFRDLFHQVNLSTAFSEHSDLYLKLQEFAYTSTEIETFFIGREGQPPGRKHTGDKQNTLVLTHLPAYRWRSRIVIKQTVAAASDLQSMQSPDGERIFPLQQIFKRMVKLPENEADLQKIIRPLIYEGLILHSEIERLTKECLTILKTSEIKAIFSEPFQYISERKILYPGKEEGYQPHRLITDGNQFIAIDFRTVEQEEPAKRLKNYGKALAELTGKPVEVREVFLRPPYPVRTLE